MFDPQDYSQSILEEIEEAKRKEDLEKKGAAANPSIFGKAASLPAPTAEPKEKLLGMKAAPTAVDNLFRFLASTGSAAAGGAAASRNPYGALIGGGIQAALNTGRLMSGNELPDVLSKENAGNLFGGLASGGTSAALTKAPRVTAGMRGLLQGAAGGAVQGGIMDEENRLGGATTGAVLGGLLDGAVGAQRTRASKTPPIVAEAAARQLQGMDPKMPNAPGFISDLANTSSKYKEAMKSFDNYYGFEATADRGVTESAYNIVNKKRQGAQLDFNNTLRSIESKLNKKLNDEQKAALKEFQAAEANLRRVSPHRDMILQKANTDLEKARIRLQEVTAEADQKGLPESYTRQAEEEYNRAVAAYNKAEDRANPKEVTAYEEALERLNAKLPTQKELLGDLDLSEQERLRTSRETLAGLKSEFEGLKKKRFESAAKEQELKKLSNELVRSASNFGAVDLDPQRLIDNPDQRAFVMRLASTDKVLDVFRKSGKGYNQVAQGFDKTFPPGTEARKNFAGKMLSELMDEVKNLGTRTSNNPYGSVKSAKLERSLAGLTPDSVNFIFENPKAYDEITGLVHNLADAEKYIKQAGQSGLRLSHAALATGGMGLIVSVGAQQIARLNTLESAMAGAGTMGALGSAYAFLTWPKMAAALMERKNSKLGEAVRRFALNKDNTGAALNVLRNDLTSLAKEGKLPVYNPNKGPSTPSTLIPPAILEEAGKSPTAVDIDPELFK